MARSPCPICHGPHTRLTGSPIRMLRRTGPALAGIVGGTPRSLLGRRPKRGEWSVVEVMAHLADVELAAGFRIRKIVSEPRPVLTAYDQEAWARALRYRRRDPGEALDTFRAVRNSNLGILRSLSRAQQRRAGIHTEYGRIRLDQLVAHLAEHDLNHLNQVRQNLRSLSPRR